MKYFSIPAAALLLATSVSPAISQSAECLIGTWTPDYDALEARIKEFIDAPNAEFSGALLMIVSTTNVLEGLEIRAEEWSVQRKDSEGDDSAFILNGSSLNSFAVSSNFFISQQSNDYVQTLISGGIETPIALQEWMLPLGDFAQGIWACADDTIQFTVTGQYADGQLVVTWYRQ